MRRGIAFDWGTFISCLAVLLAITLFEWLAKWKIDAYLIVAALLGVVVFSILSGIENRIDEAIKRIAEIEKKLSI